LFALHFHFVLNRNSGAQLAWRRSSLVYGSRRARDA
jgi:hypothetical protein